MFKIIGSVLNSLILLGVGATLILMGTVLYFSLFVSSFFRIQEPNDMINCLIGLGFIFIGGLIIYGINAKIIIDFKMMKVDLKGFRDSHESDLQQQINFLPIDKS